MDVREKLSPEKRLIDADAFLEKMKRTSRYFDVVFDVEEMPTVDAVEVVRKPVVGYVGYYEVDQFGRVFSVERVISVDDNGRKEEACEKALDGDDFILMDEYLDNEQNMTEEGAD